MSKVNTYNFATYSYPFVSNATPGTTASGSTIELISVYVPPNLFRPGETIELSFMISDPNPTSNGSKVCYWNSGTTSTTGAVYVAQWVSNNAATTTAGTQPVLRYLHIAASNVTYTSATSSLYNITQISNTEGSSGEQTATLVSLNIDWTVPSYFFVRGGVTGDKGQYIYLNRK
jgi:hypothetical protein